MENPNPAPSRGPLYAVLAGVGVVGAFAGIVLTSGVLDGPPGAVALAPPPGSTAASAEASDSGADAGATNKSTTEADPDAEAEAEAEAGTSSETGAVGAETGGTETGDADTGDAETETGDGETDAGEDDAAEGEDDTGEDDAGEDDAGEDDAGEDEAGEDDAGEDDGALVGTTEAPIPATPAPDENAATVRELLRAGKLEHFGHLAVEFRKEHSNWKTASRRCKALKIDGKRVKFRLPNLTELRKMSKARFLDAPGAYWTGSNVRDDEGKPVSAKAYEYPSGKRFVLPKTDKDLYGMCVTLIL